MYKKIAVIGVGSFGGFLANSISELDNVEELILIDFDKVERNNLINSIYREQDLNKYKVDCLYDIIKNENIKITRIYKKFIEGESSIPDCDLVIDCRDFTYDRGNLIDVRMYLSSRYLVIDCRKNTTYKKQYPGRYLVNLSRLDLRNAAFNASLCINNGLLKDLIKRQAVYEFELDHNEKAINDCLELIESKKDMIYEELPNSNKLINIEQHAYPILDMNKKKDIEIYLGDSNYPIASLNIPKKSLQSYEDVIKALSEMLNKTTYNYSYYLVSTKDRNKKCVVELLPETGAA